MRRLTHFEKGKFWACEMDGVSHRTVSGNLGGKGRETSKAYKDEETANNELGKKLRKKLREGFVFPIPEEPVAPGETLFRLWLQSPGTGFKSLDVDEANNLLILGRHVSQQGTQAKCEIVFVSTKELAVVDTIQIPEFDIWSLQLDPLRRQLYFRIDDTVSRLDLETRSHEPFAVSPLFQNLPFHLDVESNRILIGEDGYIVVKDLNANDTLLRMPVEPRVDHNQNYVGALSPRGELAAIWCKPGEIEVYELDRGELTTVIKGDFACGDQMRFHPSEPYLMTREQYGNWRFQLWNLETGEEDLRFHQHDLSPFPDWPDREKCVFYDFDISPDGSTIAFRDTQWTIVCDFSTGERRLQISEAHFCAGGFNTGGFRLKISAEGKRLVVRTDLGILSCYQLAHP